MSTLPLQLHLHQYSGKGTPNPSTEQAAAGLQSTEGTLNMFYSARGDD